MGEGFGEADIVIDFPSGCAALGGVWQTTTTGVNACVSYHLKMF